jgi:hypothetical protein
VTAEVTVFITDQDGTLASKAKRQAELVYEDGHLKSWRFLEPVQVPPGHSFRVNIPDVTGELEQRLVGSGQLPGVSMGCKVATPTCSVCGHVGEDLCEHVRAPERPVEGRAGLGDRFSIGATLSSAGPADGSGRDQNG